MPTNLATTCLAKFEKKTNHKTYQLRNNKTLKIRHKT